MNFFKKLFTRRQPQVEELVDAWQKPSPPAAEPTVVYEIRWKMKTTGQESVAVFLHPTSAEKFKAALWEAAAFLRTDFYDMPKIAKVKNSEKWKV